MLIILLFFITTSTLLSLFLFLSLKKNLELFEKLENLNETTENYLEALTFYEQKIEKKTKLEIFSDDHVIKELLNDMKNVKKIMNEIVNNLAENDS